MASFAQAERYSPPASVSSSSPSTPRPEDTAVLMRGSGRGRGRRMRVISKTKLPRMNNSERGKFYRQKYREYEEQLERDVQRLQSEVHELQRLLELRQLLPHQYPCVGLDEVRAATQVVYDGLVQLHERWASIERGSEAPAAGLVADEIRSAERVQRLQLCPSQSEHFVTRHQFSSTPLLFNLESVEIQGCSDSRIVVAHGRLYAQYQPADLETLFPVVRHNKHLAARLLAREVVYNCTYRFHTAQPFGAGELAFVSVDVDAVGGLLAAIPNLQCVEALLSPMLYSEYADVKLEVNSTTGSRRGSDDFAPSAAVSALREQYASSSPATPPRAMELAFILS